MSNAKEEMKQDMDVKLEKMQFLGIFGILQEAYKIIYTWRKILSQITLFLIFPLSLFFLAYVHISNHIIQSFLFQIIQTKSQKGPPRSFKLSDLVASYKWAYLLLFIVAYNVFLAIISIPSTSIVTYIVACIYTSGEVCFKQSLKVVTKVWKRVMITSFYCLAFSFTYDSVAACVLLLIFRVIAVVGYRFYWHVNASILIVFMVMYLVGFLYLNTIWMLSRVVSVLDEPYGFKALMKSQRLLRGKMVAATMILLFFVSFFVGVLHFFYNKVVIRGVVSGMMGKSILVILCLVLLIHFLLLKVVVLTVLYFVCKSYHRENIVNMLDLSTLVEVYVSLKANDVQVETEKLLV